MTATLAPCNLRPSTYQGFQLTQKKQEVSQPQCTRLGRSSSATLRLWQGTVCHAIYGGRSSAIEQTLTLPWVALALVRQPASMGHRAALGLTNAQAECRIVAVVDEGPFQEHPLVYVSFYKFASLPDYEQLRQKIKHKCDEQGVAGGIIVAPEGINGSICGTRTGVDSVLDHLRSDPRFASMHNTEGPGPAEAPAATSRAEDQSQGNGWVGPSGEEWKATPFQQDRVNVKVKKEVIALGVEVDPMREVGTYVKPADWNTLLEDPDVIVVDVRNEYETRIGKFRGAIDPHTLSFKDFPGWVERNLGAVQADRAASEEAASTAGREGDREAGQTGGHHRSEPGGITRPDERRSAFSASTGNSRIDPEMGGASERSDGDGREASVLDPREPFETEGEGATRGALGENLETESGVESMKARKIAMYCTGGIRCEKSTSLLLQMGFKEVYHLEGGILRYLDETPAEESLWAGECFVFDRRTSVTHGMEPGSYSLCFACKEPISPEQKASPLFITGIQCPLCAHKKTEKQKERDRQRQMQFERHGLIGGKLKQKPPKKAAAGTKRGAEETGRMGTWVTGG